MGKFNLTKLFGGTATRLELYVLFGIATVAIGGSVGGAIVYSNASSSKKLDAAIASPSPSNSQSLAKSLPSESPAPVETKTNQASASPNPKSTKKSPSETIAPEFLYDGLTQGEMLEQLINLYGYDGGPVAVMPNVPLVTAPNVMGWTYDQVKDWTLANLNRYPSWATNTFCAGVEAIPGTVVRQNPAPGSQIPNDYNPITTQATTTGIQIWTEDVADGLLDCGYR